MSDFKAKMHQIRFWLGFHGSTRNSAGELTALPRPPAGSKGPDLSSKRRKEPKHKEDGRGGKGREERLLGLNPHLATSLTP